MRKILPIVALLLFLFGCSPYPKFTPECRHLALMAASCAGERYPAQIVVSERETYGSPIFSERSHAQAQILYKGDWEWIKVDQDTGEVKVTDREHPWYTIRHTYTVEEFAVHLQQLQKIRLEPKMRANKGGEN